MKPKLLLTCPPMVQQINKYKDVLELFEYCIPKFNQTVSEDTLLNIIGDYDAWIAGDDPATREVLKAGSDGNLKVLIKWGIGTDNIDINATKEFGIKFTNTPGMFGDEVSDVAIGYLINITRSLVQINNSVKTGNWYKPSGISLRSKKVTLVGFGDIGRSIAKRLLVMGVNLYVSDPNFIKVDGKIMGDVVVDSSLNEINIEPLEACLKDSIAVILSCPLVSSTYHLINTTTINLMHDNCYIVNVSRGPVVKEEDVIEHLENGKIAGFATDVFEIEPVDINNKLLKFNNVIVGSHNASNSIDSVNRTSFKTIKLVNFYLNDENKKL